MSLNKILRLRNSILNSALNKEILELLETQHNLENALAVNETFQTYQSAVHSMHTALNDVIKNNLNYTVKGTPMNWDMLNVKPLLDFQAIAKFNSLFHSIDQTNEFSSLAAGISKHQRPLFAINYDFLLADPLDKQGENTLEDRKTIVIDESEKIKKIIADVYLKHTELVKLEPREFEYMIAELLYSQGFKVELTKQTRDGGYDILAILEMRSQAPQKWLVECKKYKEQNRVGVEVIRCFKEVVQSNFANRGIIVTTSYFTKDAWNKQRETPYLLDFKQKDDVMNWIFDYWNERIKK